MNALLFCIPHRFRLLSKSNYELWDTSSVFATLEAEVVCQRCVAVSLAYKPTRDAAVICRHRMYGTVYRFILHVSWHIMEDYN